MPVLAWTSLTGFLGGNGLYLNLPPLITALIVSIKSSAIATRRQLGISQAPSSSWMPGYNSRMRQSMPAEEGGQTEPKCPSGDGRVTKASVAFSVIEGGKGYSLEFFSPA